MNVINHRWVCGWRRHWWKKQDSLEGGTASLLTCAWWPQKMTVPSVRQAGSYFTSSTSRKILNRIQGTEQMLVAANCSLIHPHFFSFCSLPSSPPFSFSLLAVTAPSPMKFCFVKSTDHFQKRKTKKKKLAKDFGSAFSFLKLAEWWIYLGKKVPKTDFVDNKS